MQTKNYVIGRGKLYFDKFLPDTETKTGERYLGNTPSISMSSAYQDLPHYSSDQGLREQDDNATLQIDRNGTFVCDNISIENVALWFGTADATSESVLSSSGESEVFTAKLGYYYQLGSSATIPDGVGNISAVVVTNNTGLHAFGTATVGGQPTAADTFTVNGQAMTFRASASLAHEVTIGANTQITAQNIIAEVNAYPLLYDVIASGEATVITFRAIASGVGGNSITLAEAVTSASFTVSGATLAGGSASGVIGATGNYTVDLVNGRVYLVETSPDISDGDTIEIQYNIGVSTRLTVIDDNTQVEGLLRFIADNPKGTDKNYTWPRVKLTPSGEYGLKGETWQQMTFNFVVLKPAVGNRVYVREAA
jgi:hypothetical protein